MGGRRASKDLLFRNAPLYFGEHLVPPPQPASRRKPPTALKVIRHSRGRRPISLHASPQCFIMRSAAGRVTGPIRSFHQSQKDAGVPTMPARWSSLNPGERHEFVCLQIDIAGHSKLDDSKRILHEVKGRFHKQIAGLVAIHDGQPFKWEGDGGAFLFLSTEGRAFDESVYAAFDILDALPRINDQLRMAHQLSQPLSVRISLDTGVAVYDKDPGLITGDFLNAFLKHERAISLVNAVTITERVHRQISGPLRGRFTGSKHSEELGCRIYRSVSAEPKMAPDMSPEVKAPRSQPTDTPQGPPSGNVFRPPMQASVSPSRNSLVGSLSQLAPSDFATLVAMIPGAASHVSRHSTIPEQAAELVQWAESPTGPKLAAIQEVLDSFRDAPRR
jgi:hypothetical protein